MREKLERRGVAPVNFAVIFVAFEQDALAAKAWAIERHAELLDWAKEFATVAVASLAGNAVGAAFAPNAPSTSENPLTQPASNVGEPATGNFVAAKPFSERKWLMRMKNDYQAGGTPAHHRKGMALSAAVALIGLVMIAGIFSMKHSDIEKRPLSRAGDKTPTPAGDKDDKEPLTLTPAASRWQSPRFIPGGYGAQDIACQGDYVALLGGGGELDKLAIFESHDGGQSWSRNSEFKGYMNGSIAVNEKGDCAVVAYKYDLSKKIAKDSKPSDDENTLHWFHHKKGGVWSAPEPILSMPVSHYFCRPKVILTEDSAWVFQHVISLKGSNLRVAVGTNTSCPKAISRHFTFTRDIFDFTRITPVAYALNRKIAGFVLNVADRSLMCYSTTDGGSSWTEAPISFQQENIASEIIIEKIIPTALSRQDNRLALLVMAHGKSSKPLPSYVSHEEQIVQSFVLISEDLGKTWSAPQEATEIFTADVRIANPQITDMYGLHALKNGIALVCTKFTADIQNPPSLPTGKNGAPPSQEQKNEYNEQMYKLIKQFMRASIIVRFSQDSGHTWYNQHAFEKINASSAIIGGDANSAHVAFMHMNLLMVHSFTAGEWSESKDAPAWFKEEKPLAPTKENF